MTQNEALSKKLEQLKQNLRNDQEKLLQERK
jgi:hypothetical protein